MNWDPAEFPRFPETLPEKRFWAENIKYFRVVLEKALINNDHLIKDLGYEQNATKYWEKFDAIEKAIINNFEQARVDQKPEKNKIEQFFDASIEILKPVFKKFAILSNLFDVEGGPIYNLQGLVNITDKGDFAEDGITHLNFDTFLAESVRSNFGDGVFQIFNSVARQKFVFDQETIFKALDKLNLNPESHVIVAFGFINISYYLQNLKIPELKKDSYKNVPIWFFPGRIYGVSNSLFVLNKSELPRIEFRELDHKQIELYQLKPIIAQYNVYASVSDLHENAPLRIQIEKDAQQSDKDLHKSVWQGIMFTTFLRWPKDVNMVQLLIKNEFENQVKKSSLDDIVPF